MRVEEGRRGEKRREERRGCVGVSIGVSECW
jgi:hypothetical protein